MGNQFRTASPTSSFFTTAVYPSKSYPIAFPAPPSSASSSEYLYSPNNCFYQSLSSAKLEERGNPQFSILSPSVSKSSSSQLLLSLGVGSPYRKFGPVVDGGTNPADQNIPCNTLYIKNLPTKVNEVELRKLFSQCVGYKRLSFQTKSNGPMCFVEFDNISCATQALQDLHGVPLSNSVKDGIRLSFSKNPLGTRSSSSNSIQNDIPNL